MRARGVIWEAYTVTIIILIALIFGCIVTCLLGAPVYFLWFVEQVW